MYNVKYKVCITQKLVWRQTLKMLLDHFAHATYVERGKALLLLQATA